MVVVARNARWLPTVREVAQRRASIRASWSPWERRARAREATARIDYLWRLIQSPATVREFKQ